MGTISGCSEILESTESNSKSKMNAHAGKHHMLKPGQICSIEDDINKLFEAIDSKIFGRSLGLTDQVSKDKLRKKAMKRPMTPGSSSGIGFSDSVSLKQAFRGLSISQASEMAAIKRLSKPTNLSRTSNSVTKEKLYRAVVDEPTESSFPTGGNENMVEISLVPEESTSNFSEKTKSFSNLDFRHRNRSVLSKVDARSKSREKGEFSQSSKSSIGEYSSSTSTSDESTLSGHRPHMSKDLRWEVIRRFRKQNGSLGLRHFKLIKKLGGGDIGTVYLAELTGTSCLFALKIMEHEFLASKKKMSRAETEREILQMLDHPFLPTLFAHFTTDKYSVLVVDFCPGGDLHVLRQKQPNKSFPELAARFYIAEVLLSLEYLHMLGVVYRDLKPENVLVREDGHIMLLDFDLSLRCTVSPTLLKTSPLVDSPKRESNPCSDSSCIHPLCLQPSWQVPCFTPRLLSGSTRKRKLKADLATQVIPLPQLIAEPTTARSNSFVGTHEYLAPEIIKGEGHGSAVDWWTLGIFMYELVYSRTPFKGPRNEETLSNIVSHSIEFPSRPFVSAHARDLMRGLLTKDPKNRFGCVKGAVEIKQHPFFEGINWALIRCTVPPGHDKRCESENVNADVSTQNSEGVTSQEVTGEHLQFEMF